MRYLITLLFLVLAIQVNADFSYTTMVDNEGNLVLPTKDVFYEKNVKVFQQDLRIFIDTVPSQTFTTNAVNQYASNYVHAFWTDCEVKVIDKWGNLIYFTSTIALSNMQVQQLHPQLCDTTPEVYAWKIDYNDTGGCWGKRVKLTSLNHSIGSRIGTLITGIWIYPSIESTLGRAVPVFIGPNELNTLSHPKLGKGDNSSAFNVAAGYRWASWGNYVRSVFNNPDNTILVWRQTTSMGEIHSNGRKLWRPARLEYYGDFKEAK